MKFFKSLLKIAMAIIVLFILGCEKEEICSNENTITEEISKLVTIYQNGDTKLENTSDQNLQKIETPLPNV